MKMDNKELTKQQLLEYQNGGRANKHLRDEVFMRNMNLVHAITKKYYMLPNYEDLKQEGYRGLLESIERFDVYKENAFSTFATKYIQGFIGHYLEADQQIHLSTTLQRKRKQIQKFEKSYYQNYGCLPSIEDIENCTEIPRKWILMIKQMPHDKILSLDSEYSQKNNGDDSISFKDHLKSNIAIEENYLQNEIQNKLQKVLLDIVKKATQYQEVKTGTKRYEILCKHLGLDGYDPTSYDVLAKEYNVSRQSLNQIVNRIEHILNNPKFQNWVRDEFYIPNDFDNTDVIAYFEPKEDVYEL